MDAETAAAYARPPANPCPCEECRPGPGIDFASRRASTRSGARERVNELLFKEDRTSEEDTELDRLLDQLFH